MVHLMSHWHIFLQGWQVAERRYWLDLLYCWYFCDGIWTCGFLWFSVNLISRLKQKRGHLGEVFALDIGSGFGCNKIRWTKVIGVIWDVLGVWGYTGWVQRLDVV